MPLGNTKRNIAVVGIGVDYFPPFGTHAAYVGQEVAVNTPSFQPQQRAPQQQYAQQPQQKRSDRGNDKAQDAGPQNRGGRQIQPAANEQVGLAPQQPATKPDLGRLTSFGLKQKWQVALLLPSSWQDLRRVYNLYNEIGQQHEGQYILVSGTLFSEPVVKFPNGSGKSPRLIGQINDSNGHSLNFSQFGDTRKLKDELLATRRGVMLYGQVRFFNKTLWLNNVEVVGRSWAGRLRPQYPGKTKVINPETVRQRVFSHIKAAIPFACKWILSELSQFGNEHKLKQICGCPEEWTLEQMLTFCHLPKSPADGQKAQHCLEVLAGLGSIKKAWEHKKVEAEHPLQIADWSMRAHSLPFEITEEQQAAVVETINDLAGKKPMHRLLIGDVGTGKTAVYALSAVACADAGNRVVVMLPNTPLAMQIASDFRTWWPDIKVQLVTGESNDEDIDQNCPITIGTTALLFRMKSNPDYVIVDEQQKFSREQREQLVGSGTNLLEVSATCIPRSQALVRYGVLKVSTLKKCHVAKKIHTRIWPHEQRTGLFEGVKNSLSRGHQVLVVYPRKEASEGQETQEDKYNVEEAYKGWNKLFPGRVRFSHGGLTDEEKDQAIKDMQEEKADILVATTVVEIGLNIPKLYHEVVVYPDRLGLSMLHQLRGRVARAGGAGWCDLYLPTKVKDETMKRLKILVDHEDGFRIAEEDMRLRGMGDLGQNSGKQTGADDTFLFGRPISMQVLDLLLKKIS
jgi:ATP-dependent DNA helicase RecG